MWDLEKLDLSSSSPAQRFRNSIFDLGKCTDFFGLYRGSSLDGSVLHGNYKGSDDIFLAEIALRGRTIRVRECFFQNRVHSQQYTNSTRLSDSTEEVATWWAGENAKIRHHAAPITTLWLNYFKIVSKSLLSLKERCKCYFYIAGWGLFTKGNGKQIVLKR